MARDPSQRKWLHRWFNRADQVLALRTPRSREAAPIRPSASLKVGRENPDEQVGITYTLVKRTIDIIDRMAERYEARGYVFEALLTMLARKYVTD